MNKINHIIRSISAADLKISKLTNDILNLDGFSSYKIRHLLNNILNINDANYLEIGTYKGSTFISALYNNNIKNAYAIDNWSEFAEKEDIKQIFMFNCYKYLEAKKFNFIEGDCFNIDKSLIKQKINIYLYDGNHDEQSQYNALKYYYDILDDEFIFMVDDFGFDHVERGTKNIISDLNLKSLFEINIQSSQNKKVGNDKLNWWNGFFISLLKK